jgi:hypothetical protein
MTDFDSPWKEALEIYFQAFLAIFFPHIHDDINWSRGFVFLDKELQKILPEATGGRLYVDKLVKVWRTDGAESWVLIHVEVQTQRDSDFSERMYRYNTRIFAAYNRMVASLAVLADDDPHWRPETHEKAIWGWSVEMKWPAAKLLDYANRVEELENSENPFAKIVLAHLKALETRQDPERRRMWKFRLIRGLYERGVSKVDIWQLFRMIEWIMDLPPSAQRIFERDLHDYEEKRQMPFYDYHQKQAMLRLIGDLLEAKFGEEGVKLMPAIRELSDGEKYIALNRTIAVASTVEQVRRACARASAPPRKKAASKRSAPKA